MVIKSSQTTKFLTREQRLGMKSNGKITKDPFKTRTKSLTGQQRQELQKQKLSVSESASKLDKFFAGNNFKNVQDIKKELKKVDPILRARMRTNIDTIQFQQNQRINQIKLRLARVDKEILAAKSSRRSAKRSDNDDRADKFRAVEVGYRAEQRELNKFLPKFLRGEILDIKKVLNFADNVGDQARSER